jgi:hypothetical protein
MRRGCHATPPGADLAAAVKSENRGRHYIFKSREPSRVDCRCRLPPRTDRYRSARRRFDRRARLRRRNLRNCADVRNGSHCARSCWRGSLSRRNQAFAGRARYLDEAPVANRRARTARHDSCRGARNHRRRTEHCDGVCPPATIRRSMQSRDYNSRVAGLRLALRASAPV